MASNDSIDVRQALRHGIGNFAADPKGAISISQYCLAALVEDIKSVVKRERRLKSQRVAEPLLRLITLRPVRLLIAAERIVDILSGGRLTRLPNEPLPADLLGETGKVVAQSEPAVKRLERLLVTGKKRFHSPAVGILHAAGINWRPSRYGMQD